MRSILMIKKGKLNFPDPWHVSHILYVQIIINYVTLRDTSLRWDWSRSTGSWGKELLMEYKTGYLTCMQGQRSSSERNGFSSRQSLLKKSMPIFWKYGKTDTKAMRTGRVMEYM